MENKFSTLLGDLVGGFGKLLFANSIADTHSLINTLGKSKYLRGFRTIKLSVSRRSGKTTFMKQLLDRYSSVYVTYSHNSKKQLNANNVLSANEVSTGLIKYDYDIILVDEPMLCIENNNNFMNDLYSYANPDSFIIMIGTD